MFLWDGPGNMSIEEAAYSVKGTIYWAAAAIIMGCGGGTKSS